MKLTYHAHACFSVQSQNYTIVLDPFAGVDGFRDINLTANQTICSHDHFDHAYTDGVTIAATNQTNPFEISYIDCYHDECAGAKRGSNKITILKAGGKRIAHLGDLGHKLDAPALEKLRGVDALLIPVGGTYTIDAQTAIEIINDINPKMIVPMHYRDGMLNFDNISDISEFLSLADDKIKSKLALVRAYNQTIEI